MAVTIGNARISEYGTVNGKRGDQTGKEVMTQPYSTGGKWEYCIRPKTEAAAKKIANAMKAACANNNIGYSQTDRTSLYDAAVKVKYDLSKVGKCNCDCSALVAVCVNAAGIKVSPYMYSGNELALLKQTGKFTVITGADQCKKGKKLRAGDILLRKGHTAIVTSGDIALFKPAAKKKTAKQIAQEIFEGKCSDSRWKTWGVGATRRSRLKKAGYNYKEVQKEVNKLMK